MIIKYKVEVSDNHCRTWTPIELTEERKPLVFHDHCKHCGCELPVKSIIPECEKCEPPEPKVNVNEWFSVYCTKHNWPDGDYLSLDAARLSYARHHSDCDGWGHHFIRKRVTVNGVNKSDDIVEFIRMQ